MGKRAERLPTWVENSLQGLAFWIGHRRALYPHYALGESALIAEMSNLICANLKGDEILLCERPYSKLVPSGRWPDSLRTRARADLVVVQGVRRSESTRQNSLYECVTTVIEVKRASAPESEIKSDLRRLSQVKQENPKVRAFLFLIAESRRPGRYVTQDGNAVPGTEVITGTPSHYRVRRVCKAAASFGGQSRAHYSCIIEVFNGD